MILATSTTRGESGFHEIEPNDAPADFGRVAGEVTLYGTMLGADQDGYLWTVSDDDARKLWTFELQGIPGALTIVDVARLDYAENGVDVVGKTRLMKMGTRDGSKPSIHRDLLFEPGEYVIGLAQMGAGAGGQGSAAYRPPMTSLSFGETKKASRDPSGDGNVSDRAEQPGAYRFLITESGALNPSRNPGPSETQEHARRMRPGAGYSTYETRGTAWYRFDFSEADIANRWDIRAQVPVGRTLRGTLHDEQGKTLSNGRTDDKGRLRFPDLAPPAGTWFVELASADPGFVHVVSSEIVGQRVAGEEAEPNGKWGLANRVDFTQPLTGRIGGDDSSDHFLFDLDEATADQLLTLHIETEPVTKLRLCLAAENRTNVQCKDGKSPLDLPDLLLDPGTWGLYLGRASEATYSISLTAQGPAKAGFETEPNDSVQFPSGVPSNHRVKGRFSGDETDVYQLLVPGGPQLWRFQVIGDKVHEIRHYDGTGRLNASIRPRGGRRVRLDNLFLLPGRHYVSVAGRDGGTYTLLARALGPPDPNGEMEPNDESNKQRLAIGQTRTGLLSEANDKDYYRFFVANWDHLKLTMQPPVDGSVRAHVYWYGSGGIGEGRSPAVGEPLVMEGLFPPGDYHVVLSPQQVSDAEYTLSLERGPRFSPPSDSEPNGSGRLYLAAPLPAGLILSGKTGEWRDRDDYQLPALERPTEMLLLTEEPVRSVSIGTHFGVRESLTHEAELGGYRTTIPAGDPHRIMIDAGKEPYSIRLEFPNGPLQPVTEPMPVELRLELEQVAVSAYRVNGQLVTGLLRVSNSATQQLNARLEAVTSDHRWAVSLGRETVEIPAGGQIDVPVRVRVPADAWADRSVRISARGFDERGRQVETWAEVDVAREIPAVSPFLHWPVPASLRGGFNAAWSPFESTWTEDTPKDMATDLVRDGVVFPRSRAVCCTDDDGWSQSERPKLTLDLPGDEALPVRGIAINHFGTVDPFKDIRRGALLLSMDGVDFEEALAFEALPVETEQHFALEEPVAARFARLRVDATFGEASSQALSTAEWKVILEPGYDLSGGGGFNVADGVLGGHVAWDWPPKPYLPGSILKEDDSAVKAHLGRGQTRDYVIGFLQDRAAQITRIEWKYADSTPEKHRSFGPVTVSTSIESPVGPWSPLGKIDLSDARQVGSLELPAPVWARFVRFTTRRLPDSASPHAPDVIRVWERPTDGDYRSVLTEWGEIGPRAFYELQAGLHPEVSLRAVTNETRETAAPLSTSERVGGHVSLGKQVHWYRLEMPPGDNTLKLELRGDPTVRTELALENEAREAIPLKRRPSEETPSLHIMETSVEPGSDVWLKVEEPPRNVVFTWDTSASVAAYVHQINNALVAFSGQVVPGHEAVNLMPFANSLLLDDWYSEPYMLQTTLNDYRRVGSSSTAHSTLKLAAREMKSLPGTKAIVVITDAESPNDGGMWGPMQDVRPRIFGVGVGGSKIYSQDLLRDWSAINGGHFTQLLYEGEMEVAFDRATTLMHRPAGYTLIAETESREAPGPGRLSVVAGGDGDGKGKGGAGAAVELILDASGSMLQRVEGKRRIAVAKEVLTEAVREHIPPGTSVALRVFGHKEPDACRTDLEIPLGPLDPESAAHMIGTINAMNLARTPIADSLEAVASDLKGSRTGAVVLVTDGEETCEGDPGAVIEALRERGLKVSLNIVGFAIDEPELAAQFEAWAELGGGRYFSANDQGGLSEAIEQALSVPYTVYDQGGNELARGQVDGDPVELEQGIYRVFVGGLSEKTFDHVEVVGEQSVTLKLD